RRQFTPYGIPLWHARAKSRSESSSKTNAPPHPVKTTAHTAQWATSGPRRWAHASTSPESEPDLRARYWPPTEGQGPLKTNSTKPCLLPFIRTNQRVLLALLGEYVK